MSENEREKFEEVAFQQRFIASLEKTGLGGPLGIMSKDCPTKEEFLAKDAKGAYEDPSVDAAWWGWQKRGELK